MTFIVDDMDKIIIDGEVFRGIGYQGLLTTNTKTYVEEPTRSNSGAIENINDHDTFFVPRVKVNFKLFKIEDYERLCRVVSASNEYTVQYFDKQIGEFVMHKMYCEPEEMYKLFNVGFNVIGVLDYTISFIGTLNDIDDYAVTYYLNASSGDSSILSTTNHKWGGSMVTMTGDELVEIAEEKGFVLPTGTFKGWNTKDDNSGVNYYPNKKETVFSNLNLYAKWGYTLSFDSVGGSLVDSIDVIANAKIGTLPIPTRTNYKFGGWKIDNDNITKDTIYTYGQNKTAVAIWLYDTDDLTNTVWIFNETVNYPYPHTPNVEKVFNIRFVEVGQQGGYNKIRLTPHIDNQTNETMIYQYTGLGPDEVATYIDDYKVGNWNDPHRTEEQVRTIIIMGGADATNKDFIEWLSTNATFIKKLPVSNLTNTTWRFNDILDETAFGDDFAIYSGTVNFTSNNETFKVFRRYCDDGVNKLFYANDIISPETGTTVYDNGIWANDNYKTITITGGGDDREIKAIYFLSENATLIE